MLGVIGRSLQVNCACLSLAPCQWFTFTELAVFSRHAIRRIFRFAFQVAEKRPRQKLTFVTKSNAQRSGMVLWDEVAYEISQEYPHVTMDKMLVDAMVLVVLVMIPGP